MRRCRGNGSLKPADADAEVVFSLNLENSEPHLDLIKKKHCQHIKIQMTLLFIAPEIQQRHAVIIMLEDVSVALEEEGILKHL